MRRPPTLTHGNVQDRAHPMKHYGTGWRFVQGFSLVVDAQSYIKITNCYGP
jgi:hypothetical protein